jgi:hypothetical protein
MFCYDTETKKVHIFHYWNKWQHAEATMRGQQTGKEYKKDVQVRICERCGKKQVSNLDF